jgi:hypothetical protein
MRRGAASGLVILMLSAVAIVFQTTSAVANPKPMTNSSFYVETTNTSTLQQAGCNQALIDNQVQQNSMVILDFGGMNSDGSQLKTINGIWLTEQSVTYLAEWFVYGYATCQPQKVLFLNVGTNNSIQSNSTNGAAFGQTVAFVKSYAASNSGGHVDVEGANDIETWGSSVNSPTSVRNWESGYHQATPAYYRNFGSADGCPQNGAGSCSYGWAQADYYYLSWGAVEAWPVPEIYYSSQANQWNWINKSQNGSLSPNGPLDNNALAPSSNTPDQAWNQLSVYFPYITWSLEIRILS